MSSTPEVPTPLTLKQALRDPWHLLIGLGMFCQGYSFDGYIMQGVYVLLWALCILMAQPKRTVNKDLEMLLVGAGIMLAYYFGGNLGTINRLVFIGNGLVVMQVMHLVRPTTLRERKWSIGVAIVHLAIAAGMTMADYYDFIPVLIGTLLLVPKALFQLEASRYRKLVVTERIGPRKLDFAYLAVLMIVVFFSLPRVDFRSPVPGIAGGGGPLNEKLDSSGSVDDPGGDRLLFRVEGNNIGYMKTFVLDEFDGNTWTQSSWSQQKKRTELRGKPPESSWLQRRVKVVDYRAVRERLPVDGSVQRVTGPPTIDNLWVADSGAIVLALPLHTAIDYEYWTVPDDEKEQLHTRNDLERYTDLPEMSTQLKTWMTTVTKDAASPFDKSIALTNYLRDNLDYELGVPDLDRNAPIDDFIFNQKRGHCERFASAMAVLMRMQGIPARIGMGYVSGDRNDFSGFTNFRSRHAHAWAEGWFQGRGWVIMDATPAGTGPMATEVKPWQSTMFESLQDLWYSKIVQFGATEQSSVFDFVGKQTTRLAQLAWDHLAKVALLVIAVALLGLGRKLPWRRWWRKLQGPLTSQAQLREAQHFYGRMLKVLARDRWKRRRDQTPLEFLAELEAQAHPGLPDIALITRRFCAVRYGMMALSESDRDAVDAALAQLSATRFKAPHRD